MLGRKKKMTSKKYVFIGVVILIIILLIIFSFTLKEDRKLNPVESFLRDTLSYAEKIVTYPFSYITTKTREYNKLKDVNEENDILETSLDRIDAIETENVELRRQIDALKNELNIDYTLTDYEYLNATVTSRSVGYWYNTITINKGSYNGIKKDMVVINGKGLIGRVIKTSTFTSDVRLITTSETNNKISVHISNGDNNLYGLINNYDYSKNLLEVEGISNTKDVDIGDFVYTSGLAVLGGIVHGDGTGLDGDAALTLNVHVVQDLVFHGALVHALDWILKA